jgi:hypothetical protein
MRSRRKQAGWACCCGRAWLLAIALGLTAVSLPLMAQGDSSNESTRRSAAERPTTPAPKCVHGCQRWGKVCNVDPRGVYKCRRQCQKFGEICE